MSLLRFKMIHKEGTNKYFPYSPILAEAPGMTVVEMTRKQIAVAMGIKPEGQKPTAPSGGEVPVKPVKRERMKGWMKNHQGRWKRRPVKIKRAYNKKAKVAPAMEELAP